MTPQATHPERRHLDRDFEALWSIEHDGMGKRTFLAIAGPTRVACTSYADMRAVLDSHNGARADAEFARELRADIYESTSTVIAAGA